MQEEPVNQEQHGFVEQDTALESMRASDFDCYSAYGEVVDNSIQAYANDIRIEFIERINRNANSKKIARVIFCDNGTGMSVDELHKCLKLGHSSRYNDRAGIGRFGVGMTLGAIHECRRVEVYSKLKGANWHKTYLDLDEIKDGKLKFLPFPVQENPDIPTAEYIKDSGTIVIWNKYDKQVDPYERVIAESRIWFGRTFRKFLWGEAQGYSEVNIEINGRRVLAIDPLFHNKRKTGFENEEISEMHTPTKLSWTIPTEANSKLQKSTIILKTSILPDTYRRQRLKGGDAFAKERYIDRNEGVSILRNDREVFYGIIPYAKKLGSGEADINMSRFIGCEICFSAELDQEFSVKNIKRGAVPIRELKTKIEEILAPTFNTARQKIRDRWNEIDRNNQSKNNANNSDFHISDAHSDTNKLLKDNKEILLKKNKISNTDNNKAIASKIKPGGTDQELDNILTGLKENGITIDEREFIGDSFISIDHGNAIKTMFYNTNSTFYKSYKGILEEIESKNKEVANDYRVLIDLIFVGYMLAESSIDPAEEMDGTSFIEELKSHWALNLSKILKKWRN